MPLSSLAATGSQQGYIYVQVRESKLRSQPNFWSPAVGNLSYGDSLVPFGAAPSSNAWLKAKLGDTEGFVHVSAVTSRRIVIKTSAGQQQKVADTEDIVLAGKGFNNQVEGRYAASKGVSFASVDDVEKISAPSGEEARVFLQNGKLSTD